MFRLLVVSLLAVTLLTLSSIATASDSSVVFEEYDRFFELVSQLEPDYEVGDFLKAKEYGHGKLLWRLADRPGSYDVIHFFNKHYDGTDNFFVSYYRGTHLVEGRNVLRRFIGPAMIGWRNHTFDFETREYLGRQGSPRPAMTDEDREILEQWDITPLD